MFDLEKIIRPNILKLQPYQSARDEFIGNAEVFLDANENPLGSVGFKKAIYHRYPDPHQYFVKKKIAKIKQVADKEVFLGNGSDEIIDLIIRATCKPLQDEMIILPPTYGMYEVFGKINNILIKKVNLNEDFQMNMFELLKEISSKTKIIFICSPNNPSGNTIRNGDIINILEEFNGLVVIDEAYIDFAPGKTLLPLIKHYDNLVIIQTFSKAWGLAGIRLGMGFAHWRIIEILDKMKPPYNVNQITQQAALCALDNVSQKENYVENIISQRNLLEKTIPHMPEVIQVFQSEANFLLVKVKDANLLYSYLISHGIVVRNRHQQYGCDNCIRISVGSPEENIKLLDQWSKFQKKKKILHENQLSDEIIQHFALEDKPRIALVNRKTNETEIKIELHLDETGKNNINTGLRFFDHMLEQISRHGMLDLFVEVKGDLAIDEHHSIEDTALVLGEAFNKALGEKRGIERYGFCLPMDDCLAQVALDFGGRSWLVWNVEFKREKIGEVPTEMFFHFFKSFSEAARCNLNIQADGENEHHKIEAIFKAFAKAIRMAVKTDPYGSSIPSTKGLI